MHVELVDLFRCLEPHEGSWLVAAAHETVERVIVNGVLGCPVCGSEYPIVNGVTDFTRSVLLDSTAASFVEHVHHLHDRNENATDDGDAIDDDATFRLAAQLDLTSAGKTVALIGYHMQHALALLQLVPSRVVLVNGSAEHHEQHGAPIARINCGDVLPVADASLHGIASRIDWLPSNAVRVLNGGGRLIAPAHLDMPTGTNEIARDHREWVVARDTVPSTPVQLGRRQVSE